MKHTKLFICFNLILCNFGFAQDKLTSFVLNSNIKNYFTKVNNAEAFIIKADYKNAAVLYDSAFLLNRFPFSKDLVNALLVNINIKNENKSIILYNRLAALGFTKEYFTKYSIENNKEVKEFLQNNKKLLTKPVVKSSTINYKLIKILGKIVEDDQYYRSKPDGYIKFENEIKKGDSINTKKIINLVKKYGFPDDYSLGIDIDKINSHLFYYILFHQSQRRDLNINDMLLDAVNKGRLEPHMAGDMIDTYYSGMILGNVKIIKINKKENDDSCCFITNHKFDNDNEKLNLYQQNKLRQKIGIEKVQETEKILSYLFKNKTLFVFPQGGFAATIILGMEREEFFKFFGRKKLLNMNDVIDN